jgi:hypothetical protein
MVKATKEKKKLWVSARAWELLNSKITGGFQTRALASVKSRLGEESMYSSDRRPCLLSSWRRGGRGKFFGATENIFAEMEERN